eukprot:8543196-Pyramimonas_sp.AAC.1
MGSSRIGRRSSGPAPPSGLGSRRPSGSASSLGHAPEASASSRRSAIQPCSSAGRRRSSLM